MKKVLIFYVLLVVVIVIFALSRGTNLFHFGASTGNSTAKIGNKTYKLIIAKTDAERIKGLSGRASLAEAEGMLFTFSKKDIYSFWMKDMRFPIDILFISDDKIVDLVENAQAPEKDQDPSTLPVYKSSEPANMVLEVNANEISKNKIKKGDTVVLTGVK